MHSAFVKLDEVPTLVRSWGRWVEESSKPNEDIVIMIPGNPGLTGYYQYFLKHLHDNLGYTCWAVGHSGHEEPDEKYIQVPPLKGNENQFNLQAQVNHKIDFFKKYVPEDARVHIIGHSIGAYVILELMKIPEINKRIKNAYLLFPAIERMSETPHGKFFFNYKSIIYFVLAYLSIIFTYFPYFFQYLCIYVYSCISVMESRFIPTTIHLIQPSILRKVYYMAMDELKNVKELDLDLLKKNKQKLRLYYATEDGWAPSVFCKRLQEQVPDVRIETCTRNFTHAYILTHSEPAADMITEWIRNDN